MFFAACFLGFTAISYVFDSPPLWQLGDYSHYWCTGRLYLTESSPYGVDMSRHPVGEGFDWSSEFIIRYASNPPPLLLFLLPLATFDPQTGWWIWMLAGFLTYAGALTLIPLLKEPEKNATADWKQLGGWLLLVLGSFPVWDWIRHGQISGLLAAMLVLACWCLHRKQEFLSGFVCGIATGLKVYPGLTFLYFTAAKKSKAMLGFVCGFALTVLLPLAFFSTTLYRQWLDKGMEVISHGEKLLTNNAGFTGLIYKLEHAFHWESPGGQLERIIPGLVAVGMTVLLAYRARDSRWQVPCLALVVSWAAFCSPVAWPHYGCHHLVTSLLFLNAGYSRTALAFWLLTLSLPVYFLLPVVGSGLFFLGLSVLMLLGLCGMTWVLLRRKKRPMLEADLR
jgi:hypothetical protein